MTPALLVAAGLALSGEAPADEAPLRWVVADTSCPTRDVVRTMVVDLAGRWPTRAELEVDAFVHAGTPWTMVLTVVVGGRVHRQQLEAESCPALARAAALIVAVSVDPIASAAAVPVPAATAPAVTQRREASATPPVPMVADTVEGPSSRRRPSVRPYGGAGWSIVSGMTPGLSSGPTLSLGLGMERARVGVVARYVLPRTATDGGSAARVEAGTIAATGCLATRPRVVRGHVCGAVEGGGVRARGRDVAGPRTQRYPWLAGVVGGGLRWEFAPRVALAADLAGAIAAFDAQVLVDSGARAPTVLFENPRIGVRGTLGIEFDFSRRR